MKTINNYITERLHITKQSKAYKYFPKTKEELRKILEERLKEDKNANLNDIDVSKITEMGLNNSYISLFEGLDPHNIDISEWDVSNVTNMSYMFYRCENFNSDLSNWDVSNVTHMHFMFEYCENFNSDLSKWNVSKVEDMIDMFRESLLENHPPKWYKE